MNPSYSNLTASGYKKILFAFAILAFFFDWVTVAAQGCRFHLSGFDLVFGKVVCGVDGTEWVLFPQVLPTFLMIVAAAGLALNFIETRYTGLSFLLALIAVFGLLFLRMDYRDSFEQQYFEIEDIGFHWGYWISIAVFALVGIIDYCQFISAARAGGIYINIVQDDPSDPKSSS